MSQRSRDYNRYVSNKKALRKRRITQELGWGVKGVSPYYQSLHEYSKNKIHCGCPLCSTKTRNKGKRKHKCWDKSLNYSVSDQRKIDTLNYDMIDYGI